MPDYFGDDGKSEAGARILRLEDALDLATKYSRIYQTRKEQLYLSGLTLTLIRHQFTPYLLSLGQRRNLWPDGNGRQI